MLRAFEKTWRTVRIEWEKSKFVAMIVASLEKLAGGVNVSKFVSVYYSSIESVGKGMIRLMHVSFNVSKRVLLFFTTIKSARSNVKNKGKREIIRKFNTRIRFYIKNGYSY